MRQAALLQHNGDPPALLHRYRPLQQIRAVQASRQQIANREIPVIARIFILQLGADVGDALLRRDEVDAVTDAALAAGATDHDDTEDYGFMYSRSFFDLDGHGWQVMWMDPAAAQQGPEAFVASMQDADAPS